MKTLEIILPKGNILTISKSELNTAKLKKLVTEGFTSFNAPFPVHVNEKAIKSINGKSKKTQQYFEIQKFID